MAVVDDTTAVKGTTMAPRRDAEDRRRIRLLAERMRTDPDYAAAERDRARRIRADKTLDDRLKALYLDDTILATDEVADLADVSEQRVWNWRGPAAAERRDQPHPRILPLYDVSLGVVADKPVPGIKRGKVWEWMIADTHRYLWDAATGTVYKNPNPPRHGAPRTRS